MRRIAMLLSVFATSVSGCANATDVGASEGALSNDGSDKEYKLCRVTGGGQVSSEDGIWLDDPNHDFVVTGNPDSFGGNAQPFKDGIGGEWNHVTHDGGHFHGSPERIHCFDVPGPPASPPAAPFNAAYFSGRGRWNAEPGCKFYVYTEDHGEPGTDDFYSIDIWCPSGASYYTEGTLLHGNIQIHPVPPGHTPS